MCDLLQINDLLLLQVLIPTSIPKILVSILRGLLTVMFWSFLWTGDFKSCSFWRQTLKFWETSMRTIWNRFGNTWGNWRPYFLDRNMFLASFKQLLVAYLIMISPMIIVDLIIQSIRYFLEFLQRSRLSVLRDYERVQYFLVPWILIATL